MITLGVRLGLEDENEEVIYTPWMSNQDYGRSLEIGNCDFVSQVAQIYWISISINELSGFVYPYWV